MSTISSTATELDAVPVAEVVGPVVEALLGPRPPVRVRLWDGGIVGADGPDAIATLYVRSPDALRRILWSPNELGFARAFVSGELDVDGDLYEVVPALRDVMREAQPAVSALPAIARAAKRLGMIGPPLPPPAAEARMKGWRHSLRRDAEAIGHHYDVGNDFYRIVLGPSMTYSCARFSDPGMDLAAAQAAKHELVCRKLGLDERPGGRLLDVGCGWGQMAIHAATHHDVSVVGITISEAQAALARQRVAEAGVADRVEIRLQDFRAVRGEQFDAVSSVGMSEHVGAKHLADYFEILHSVLAPQGRLLNHAISSVGGSKLGRTSFIGRYVFPDGELIDVGDSVLAMERAGFEVRDVESLREHYALTLRAWVANLEAGWDDAVALVGLERARVWRLYMTGSVIGFTDGGIAVHQVLGVVPSADGASGMPATNRAWD
ncbi:MAG: cyclopropane-fatty-acyl-phospholipid synthase family protein [Ilumatobacteraceae bacterium]